MRSPGFSFCEWRRSSSSSCSSSIRYSYYYTLCMPFCLSHCCTLSSSLHFLLSVSTPHRIRMNPSERQQKWATMAKDMSDAEKLYKYKGVLYPHIMSPEENLKALESFQAREDDIMLVAYPKCGEWLRIDCWTVRSSSEAATSEL